MKKYLVLFVFFSFYNATGAFGNPFGISFGMSHEQIENISRTQPLIIEGWHIITPPNTHVLFEIYAVRIHPTYGVYIIRAISRDISTNRYGTELTGHFNNLVSNLERLYGDYYRIDRLNPEERIFNRAQDFMHTLSRGTRELAVFWHREEGSRLPDDIYEIIIYVEARTSRAGNIVIEYYSMNFERIEKERFSVF